MTEQRESEIGRLKNLAEKQRLKMQAYREDALARGTHPMTEQLTALADKIERAEGASIEDLAAFHHGQGVLHARLAMNNAPWYRNHAQDTRRAVDHFTVAAALRAEASK